MGGESEACPGCGGETVSLSNATCQCTRCGRIIGDPEAVESQENKAGRRSIDAPTREKDPDAQFIYVEGALRNLRSKRTFLATGGALVLIGSMILLLSPPLALILAKAIIEAEVQHPIGWADMLNFVLTTGPGTIICVGTLIIFIVGMLGVRLAVMMIRGVTLSHKEISLQALAIAVAGSATSLLAIGGLFGVAGAALVLIGGYIAVLLP